MAEGLSLRLLDLRKFFPIFHKLKPISIAREPKLTAEAVGLGWRAPKSSKDEIAALNADDDFLRLME